jgi:hypothetical protein
VNTETLGHVDGAARTGTVLAVKSKTWTGHNQI